MNVTQHTISINNVNVINKELKNKVIIAKVWSVALYGSETWTLRKYERDRLEAFEMLTGAIWKISAGRKKSDGLDTS